MRLPRNSLPIFTDFGPRSFRSYRFLKLTRAVQKRQNDYIQIMNPTFEPHRPVRFVPVVSVNHKDHLYGYESERMQGFAADPDYWKGEVFAYVGLPQSLKDLKEKRRE